MIEPVKCRCGGTPETFTQFPVSKQKYKGEVICPDCGMRILGAQWTWSEYDAVEDAIEEWNKAMMMEGK